MNALKTGIFSLVFGFVFVGVVFEILYLGFPLALAFKNPIHAEAVNSDELKAQMEQLFNVCAYEYRYNTIVTRTKVKTFGDMKLGRDSKLLIHAEGVIKAGCKVKGLAIEEGLVIITIGQPTVIESHVESMGVIEEVERVLSKFDMTEDKDASDRVHVKIQEQIYDELMNGATEKTKDILSGFLVSAGVKETNIRFEIE